MFVSSYNTYANISNLQKNSSVKTKEKKSDFSSFSSKYTKTLPLALADIKNKPVLSLYNSRTYSNKYKLQEQTQNSNQLIFNKIKSIKNANRAYTENSKVYYSFSKHISLDQTPKIDKKLSPNIQKSKINITRHTMVNTYIQNDNYYKITA